MRSLIVSPKTLGGQQCAKPSVTFLRFTMRQEYPALFMSCICGPGSSVGIATGYELDGPGIESRWGRDFSRLSRPALGPTQPPVQGYRVLPGVKSGRGVGLTPHPLLVPWSRKNTPLMGCTACTEPQCLYKGALYFYLYITYIPTLCITP